jgi:hypothetical protein
MTIALIAVIALGIALIVIGSWGLATAGTIDGLQENYPIAFGFYIACIVVGCVLLLSSVSGFLAVCKGKTNCTNIFAALMLCCCILLLALAIVATVSYVAFNGDPEGFMNAIWRALPPSAKQSFGSQYNCDYTLELTLYASASCYIPLKNTIQQWAIPGLACSWAAFALLAIVTALMCGLNRREKAAAASSPALETKQQVIVQAPQPVYSQPVYSAPATQVYSQPVYSAPATQVYAAPATQMAETAYAQPGTQVAYAAPATQVAYAAPATQV